MPVPRAVEVIAKANISTTAQDIAVNGRPCMVANTGSQPLYINPATTATSSNGFLIPAGTLLQQRFSVFGNLSVISNANGTSCAVMIFDI